MNRQPADASRAPGEPGPVSPPASVQVLFGLKSADPTAQTADEAIRHLLGFEERLVAVHRRLLHEWVLQWPREPEALLESVCVYLERTAALWNPNKQRGWVRIDAGAGRAAQAGPEDGWEVLPGGRRRASRFGQPWLGDAGYDHLLVWSRGEENVPSDLPDDLRGPLLACGRGELYTLQWASVSSPEERRAWTAAVAVARSRRQGLLVNPHYQDHRQFEGTVPLPLWSG